MDMIKDYVIKYKEDILSIFLFTFLFFLMILAKHIAPFDIVDVGREVYVPKLILEGKVLYKDVFMMHPPLAYQINALLYYIFGMSTKTLIAASYINSYLIVILSYFISRCFLKQLYSFTISGFIMSIVITGSSVLNYITPYSYGMVYSVTALLGFVLCIIKYFSNPEKYRFCQFLGAFIFGIAFAMKQDFIFLYIVYFIFLLFKKSLKTALISIIYFSIVPTLSWGYCFAHGTELSDVINFLEFQKKLLATKEWYFYTFRTNAPVYIAILRKLILAIQGFVVGIVFFIINVYALEKIIYHFSLFNLIYVFLFLFFNTTTFIISTISYSVYSSDIACLKGICFVLIPICIYKYIHKDKDYLIYIILSIISILSSVREYFVFLNYGKFLGLLPIILVLIFIFQSKLKDETKKAFCFFILFIALISPIYNIYLYRSCSSPVSTHVSTIIMDAQQGELYDIILKWVEKNTNKDDKILVLPESPLVNFLADRPTDNKYYQLSPDHIKAFGEENIVNDLKRNPPNYIIILKMDCYPYGTHYFGKDFGLDLFKFITTNYKNMATIKDREADYKLMIFGIKKT